MCRSLSGHERFGQPMAMTSLSHLVSQVCSKIIAFTHNCEKTSACAAACPNMFNVSCPWSPPHFSTLGPKLGRELLPPLPFLKKRTPGPPVVLKNQISTCHGKDPTVPCRVPDLAEHFCMDILFPKKMSMCRGLPGHVRIC